MRFPPGSIGLRVCTPEGLPNHPENSTVQNNVDLNFIFWSLNFNLLGLYVWYRNFAHNCPVNNKIVLLWETARGILPMT